MRDQIQCQKLQKMYKNVEALNVSSTFMECLPVILAVLEGVGAGENRKNDESNRLEHD